MTKVFLSLVTLSGVLFAGTEAMAAKLACYSNRNAPAYMDSSGQWSLKAEVQSEWTIKEAVLKNRSNLQLGGESPRVTYDKKTSDVRVFKLKPDVNCNYELVVPRDWKTAANFQADLEMTCDDMYDGKAILNCTVK